MKHQELETRIGEQFPQTFFSQSTICLRNDTTRTIRDAIRRITALCSGEHI